MMQASVSGATTLPSLGSEESVTLQSLNGQGLGFDIRANDDGSFTVGDVKSDGAAGVSGKIKPGDRLTDIGIDLSKLRPEDAPKLLNAIASFPVKYSIKKHGSRPANLDAGLKLDAPKFNIGINGVKGDSTMPEGRQDVGFVGTGPSIASGAAVNLPDISVEVNGTSKGGIDINLPQVEIDHGGVELSEGKAGSIGNKLKGFFSPGNGKKGKHGKGGGKIEADVSLPVVEFKSGKIDENSGASVRPGDVKLSFETPKVDIYEPSVERDLKAKVPKADRESWFNKHKPKISLGKSGKYSVSDASATIDAYVPGVDGNMTEQKGDLRGKMELKGKLPTVDIDGQRNSGESGDNNQQPIADITVTRPDIGTSIEAHIGLPKDKMEASIPETTGNISVTAPMSPDVDLESPSTSMGGKIKGFFKRRDSKRKKPTPSEDSGALKLDLDADFPNVKVDVNTDLSPPQQGQLKSPKADFNNSIETGKGNAGLRGSVEADLPRVNDIKRSKGSGGIHFGLPRLSFKSKSPKADSKIGGNDLCGGVEGSIKGSVSSPVKDTNTANPLFDQSPEIKVEKKSLGGKMKGFFTGPGKKIGETNDAVAIDVDIPEINFNDSVQKIKPEGTVSIPSRNIEGAVDLKNHDVDVKGKKPKGSGRFGIKMPSLDFKGKGTKANVDIGADASLPYENIEGAVDADLPDVKLKGEMNQGGGGVGINLPTADLKGKSPGKFDVDIGGNASILSGNIAGEIDADLPDIKVKGEKPKTSGGFGIKLPAFDLKATGPNADADFGVDASLPCGKIEGKVDTDLPHIRLKADKPKAGGEIEFTSPFDLKGTGEKGHIEIGAGTSLQSPKLHGEVDAQHHDVEIKGKKPKGRGGIEIKLPSFGFKGKKAKRDAEVGANVSLPSGKIEGEIDSHHPDVDLKGKKPKASGGFGIKMPSLDFKGKGPKVNVDIGADVSLPSGKIEGEVDADLPDLKLKGEKNKGSGGVGINLPTADLKGKSPGKFDVNIGGDASILSAGNIKGEIDADLPDIKVKGEKPKASGGFDIKLPALDLKTTGPKAEVEFGGSASLPSGNIGAEIGADLPDIKVKGEKPKGGGGFGIKLPSLDLKTTGPIADINVGGNASLPSGNIGGDIDADLFDIKIKGGKVDSDLPDISADGSGAFFEAQLPRSETRLVDDFGSVALHAQSLNNGAEEPKVNVSVRSDRLGTPSAETAHLDFKSDKRNSLGRKVKGLFSSKDRKSSPKADVDVSVGAGGGKAAVGAATAAVASVSSPGAHADLKKGQDGECGFDTSCDVDAGLNQEAAIDVPSSPSTISTGDEAAAAAAEGSSPTSDNERSMLHDEKGQEFRVRIGSGKSSKSKTERKKRPRVEDGLRSGLATELIAGAGRVQLPEQDDKCQQLR